MKQWILVGIAAGAFGLSAQAQQPHQQPLPGQPNVAAAPAVPTGEMALGAVRIPRSVRAGGETLPAGTYQLRLTAESPKPEAVGITPALERYVEFMQGGKVRAREVASIIPSSEISTVAKGAPPPTGGNRVQMLAGNDYLRIWLNRQGNHILLHLPIG